MKKLQTGRPAFGPAGQLGQFNRRKRLAVEVAEEVFHLPRPEAEVVTTDLGQGPGHAQTRKVEGRLRTGGDDRQQVGRRVVDEALESFGGRRAVDRVRVDDAKHQTDVAGPTEVTSSILH